MEPDPPRQTELPLFAGSEFKKTKREPRFRGYLVNPVKVRQYALDLASRERHHEFTAVTVEFIQRIDARLRNIIQDEIKRHPSKGKRLA